MIPTPERRSRALVAGGVVLAMVAAAVWLGGTWWKAEAVSYAGAVYRPLSIDPALHNGILDLKIGSLAASGRRSKTRLNTDLMPDHGHLMHLYAIREPQMDAIYHLHPHEVSPGELQTRLPELPPGRYRLFADIVHRSGLPETLTSTLDVPSGFQGGPLDGEDAAAAPAPLFAGMLGPADKLPDGYTIVWDKPATLRANEAVMFRFKMLNAQGKPATDVVPYLGMPGHAAFVKTDWTAFAHTHPAGSAPMQDVMLANPEAMEGMSAPGKSSAPLPPMVEFPYGFPATGHYRIFVQMKHGSTVETGTFDAEVK